MTSNTGFVVNKSVNPVKWNNTRLGQVARCYSLYRPKSLTITWVPSCAATTPGSIIYGISYGYNLTNDTETIDSAQQLLSTPGSKLVSVNSKHSWTVPFNSLPQKWFYVDSEHDVDSEPCRILAILIDVAHNTSPAQGLGFMTIEYHYEFREPVAQQTVAKELELSASVNTTSGANQQATLTLGSDYNYTSVVFSEVATSIASYIKAGVRYQLGKVVGAVGNYFLSYMGVPTLLPATLGTAAAVSGALEYTVQDAPDPTRLQLAVLGHDESGSLMVLSTNLNAQCRSQCNGTAPGSHIPMRM